MALIIHKPQAAAAGDGYPGPWKGAGGNGGLYGGGAGGGMQTGAPVGAGGILVFTYATPNQVIFGPGIIIDGNFTLG